VLPRFSMTSSGGATAGTDAGPDFLERRFATPSIPAVSPLTLPAPAGGGSGGGGGGSRAGGGGLGGGAGGEGGQFFTTPGFFGPLDPAELADFLARSEQRTMPDINVTVNAAIAEASLGQTIVDALKDYTRSSGPLELQIAV
jgi:hypothetical protein